MSDISAAEWERIRHFPVEERNRIMLDVYNGLDEATRYLIDDWIENLIVEVRKQKVYARFSRSMAREIIFNTILMETVKWDCGADGLFTNHNGRH